MFEEGYFTYPNLYAHVVRKFPSNSHFVEVGCWKGRSAAFMAVEIKNSGKNIRFDCIDPWEENQDGQCVGNIYGKFMENTKRVSNLITAIRTTSVNAASTYEDNSVDFVFIDGHHAYDSVVADLEAWLPKMKSGGLLAGHDYAWCEDVRRAVHKVLGEGTDSYTDRYGIGYKSYDDPWGEGCWIINID
jgi:predicted O-methyltransferase YrrM